MKFPLGRTFRLVSRGGPGLACDGAGVDLGNVSLVRVASCDGVRRIEVRPIGEFDAILSMAYGPQRPDVVQRFHRGLGRAAARLQVGDVALAALEAVMIGFPDPEPYALAKLAAFADLEKAGTAWEEEPRVPAGQTIGGEWTSGGGGAASTAGTADARVTRPSRSSPSASGSMGLPLDDGVYRPGADRPAATLTGVGEEAAEDGFRQGIGGNEPPYDFMELSELFPGLKNQPGLIIPMAPIDSFLGISGLANQANLDAASIEYKSLCDQIRALDPSYRHDELAPLASLSWEGRNSVIRDLRMDLAATYYRVRGNLGPLQVETAMFLQREVDKAYDQAVQRYNRNEIKTPLSRELAIGNEVDVLVRDELKELFRAHGIPFGLGRNITINNRDANSEDQTYTRPDARLGNGSFDWSLAQKSLSTRQVRGFFRADSSPNFVIIIRPSQLGRGSSYIITRPSPPIRRISSWSNMYPMFQSHLKT